MPARLCCDIAFFPLWLTEPSAAAWAGALASFLAVVAALAIAVVGARQEAKLRAQTTQERKHSAVLSLAYAMSHLRSLGRAHEFSGPRRNEMIVAIAESAYGHLERARQADPYSSGVVAVANQLEVATASISRLLSGSKYEWTDDQIKRLGAELDATLNLAGVTLEQWGVKIEVHDVDIEDYFTVPATAAN